MAVYGVRIYIISAVLIYVTNMFQEESLVILS